MYRSGVDHENVQIGDVLCDFCGQPWREDLPLVEGHRGAVICGQCLSAAYRSLVLAGGGDEGGACVLCRERRGERTWAKPAGPTHWETELTGGVARACLRCVKQSAAVLAKDRDWGWTKPTA